MYPVAIALLGAAGAWLAWRRNPLFSADSAVRLLGVTVLSVCALMLLVIAAVDHTSHRAEPVVFTTMLTVVILGTLALLYIAQAASIPKSAQLTIVVPPAVKVLYFHRQRVHHWGRVMLLLLVACALLGALSPGPARYIVLSCAAMLGVIAAFVLPMMYYSALKFDLSLSALECDPWIHWRYSPEQWKRWSEARTARIEPGSTAATWKRHARRLVWLLGLIAAGVLMYSRGSLAERVDYTLLCLGVVALTIILGARLDSRLPGPMVATGGGSPEAYFGHDGLFVDGLYTLWLGASVYLVCAAIDQRNPRSLVFKFEKIALNPYGPNKVVALHQYVPVPEGSEADLQRLQRELKARCPKARVAIA